MGFSSLTSTHSTICISHFFQELEDSRCGICQKPGEEDNLLRTFCVQAWNTLGNAVNFGKILKTDKYLDDTEKKCINPIFLSD